MLVPISENQVIIDPAKKNELRDSPLYRSGFLNGATIYLDPRISGVRDDGVPWIGSPLIDASAYYQLVGVGVDRLMTKGGSVTFGTGFSPGTYVPPQGLGHPNTVILREGAVIDMSGGWATYEAGIIRSTQLIDSTGHIVDISRADPNGIYVGIYDGWMRNHSRWGVAETWRDPLGRSSGHYVAGYSEGRDAGILQVATSALCARRHLLRPGPPRRTADRRGQGRHRQIDFLRRRPRGTGRELRTARRRRTDLPA